MSSVGSSDSRLRVLLLLGLSYGLVLAASPLTAPGAYAATPRVVIIVGPAGRATDGYRADGDQAAKVARAAGASVTTIYSPNAGWPKVKAALQGASIVVYMGHGNGFPSRYGPVLNKATKDGLGLNPIAGIDDAAHQYFGEAYLTRHIRLAPHAVVLLHHLCYASGNSEPGLPEGGLATGKQRVDNMAAGWLAAGAEAVLAEAYGDPAYYLGKILAGRSTVEAIWRTGPTAHEHVLAFPSVRTPGLTALMDPTKRSSGFYRSLVVRADLRANEVAAGAALVDRSSDPVATPSLSARTGPKVSGVTLQGIPTVGAQLDLDVALEAPGSVPTGQLGVGVRWDPIVIDPRTAYVDRSAPAIAPSASAPPEPSGTPVPPSPAQAGNLPVASPSIEEPATPPLVMPEVLGAVVELVAVKSTARNLTAAIVAPDAPGLYRLVTTVHDADGAAFDTGAEPPTRALIVRVMGPLSAVVAAPTHLDVVAGSTVDLPVAVMNSGIVPWVTNDPATDEDERKPARSSGSTALLAGHWVRLETSTSPSEDGPVSVRLDAAPGLTDIVSLRLSAPGRQGEYLLILDVVSRVDGSLAAAGGDPVVVRVTVTQRGTFGGS